VIVPALARDALHFWLSDADRAIAEADAVRSQTLRRLEAEGAPASGHTGTASRSWRSPTRCGASRPIGSCCSDPSSQQRYREDIDPTEIEERFGLPVDHALVSS